jgi:hypothetical protein
MGSRSIRNQREKSELFSLRDKITVSFVRTQSNLTVNSNTSGSSPTKSEKCMNIKIASVTLKFARSGLNISNLGLRNTNYVDDYNLIKSTNNFFTIQKSHFFTACHDVCIHNMNIKDCIIILLISLYSNEGVEISLIKTYPYLFIKGEINNVSLELLKAWREFISAIESITKSNLSQLENSRLNLENLLNSIPSPKQMQFPSEIKKIQQAISACSSILDEARDLKQTIINFIKSLESWQLSQIKKLGQNARVIEAHRGDQIVHLILT